MTKINPDIIVWARTTAGFSIQDACRVLQISDTKKLAAPDKLNALENGQIEPTRPMLVKMAKQYNRPLLVFYMDKIPSKGSRGQDFRTITEARSPISDAHVDALIRDIKIRQMLLREALEDDEDFSPIRIVNSITQKINVSDAANYIREQIKFDLIEFRKKSDASQAFNYLRAKIEDSGVFVLLIGDLGSFHTSIDTMSFRGFALSDAIAPMIMINDKDAKAAWSFTLLHELTHICLGDTGISNSVSEKSIEKFCDSVAGLILLRDDELAELTPFIDQPVEKFCEAISTFADKRNVSRPMVAYRLSRLGMIDGNIYSQITQIFSTQWIKSKEIARMNTDPNQKINYFLVKRSHLGKKLVTTVQDLLVTGKITTTKASRIFGINALSVQRVFPERKR